MITDIQKEKLKNFAQNEKLSLLILFGSFAKNKEKLNSDIDISYLSDKKLDDLKLIDKISEIFEHKSEIDLINLNRLELSHHLVFKIFKEGNLIYERDKNLFLHKKEESYFNYIDYKRFDKMHENILRRKIKV